MFDEMPSPKLISWTSMISSLIRSGQMEHALQEFSLLVSSGLRPNEYGYSLALKASHLAANPLLGKLIHCSAIKSGFEANAFCSTAILDMYVKCGYMLDAQRLFDVVSIKCEALWNVLIDGYARCLDVGCATGLFHRMLRSCTSPNSFTYSSLIRALADIVDMNLLRFLHGRIIKVGFDMNNFVGGALVDGYAKCGEVENASKVFWSLQERDLVVWTALLSGVCQNGHTEEGLYLYLKFLSEGHKPDEFMFASVFLLCLDLGMVDLGLQVHSCFVKSGFVVDSFIGSALIDMFSGFKMITDAYQCFLDTKDKNKIIFASMLDGFLCDPDFQSVSGLISQMFELGLVADSSTLNCMLRVCTRLKMLKQGKVIHAVALKTIVKLDLFTVNNLLEMYAKCEAINAAVQLFRLMDARNEFSWTALISGYIDSEMHEEALEVFKFMQSSDDVKPSEFTLVAVLQACSKVSSQLQRGEQTHGYIEKLGFHSSVYIEAALIGMYARCNHLNHACRIFSSMSQRDLVSWSTIIASHVHRGQAEKALKLFLEHQTDVTTVDESIFSSCLSACSSLTALEMGKCIHVTILKTGFESNVQVGSAIVDLYCKCGSIKEARKYFDEMIEHNVVSYSAMIAGYAQHGQVQEVMYLFEDMQNAGMKPDSVAFIGVLSACSHFGLVEEGWDYFESMEVYGLERTATHYACMVDLLGRSGHIDEAEKLINTAPLPLKTQLWRTLLGACSKYGNIEVGKRIAETLIRLGPDEASTYVSLSNIYAFVSAWDQSTKAKKKSKEASLRKTPGCSWIALAD